MVKNIGNSIHVSKFAKPILILFINLGLLHLHSGQILYRTKQKNFTNTLKFKTEFQIKLHNILTNLAKLIYKRIKLFGHLSIT